MDARQRRSRAALHRAIIELASEQSVAGLTVADVTSRAGVNRTTFYGHATTTADLLQDALRTELDAIRSAFLDDVHRSPVFAERPSAHASRAARTSASGAVAPPLAGTDAAIRNVTVGVLHHIDEHAALYTRAFNDPGNDAGLRTMLSAHFETTTEMALRDHALHLPDSDDATPEEHALFVATAPRFIAVGAVAAMEFWLATPAPRDIDLFLRVYRQLLPEWWPLSVNN